MPRWERPAPASIHLHALCTTRNLKRNVTSSWSLLSSLSSGIGSQSVKVCDICERIMNLWEEFNLANLFVQHTMFWFDGFETFALLGNSDSNWWTRWFKFFLPVYSVLRMIWAVSIDTQFTEHWNIYKYSIEIWHCWQNISKVFNTIVEIE